ncbi:MAG: flagellar export chaperone FliS [Sedimentisphaerales bacterium]|nr:flagellar export chaperone FliS [Sedimentisphaerales bacterium]
MNYAANTNEYLRTKVMTASPEQLTMMLYDGVVRFSEQAREAILNKDYENSYKLIVKAQNIVSEFMSTLKDEYDPDIAGKMRALYMFCYRQLVEANLRRDIEKLDSAIKILRHMRETWSMLLEKLATGDCDSASQGLTSNDILSAEEILGDEVGSHICLEG